MTKGCTGATAGTVAFFCAVVAPHIDEATARGTCRKRSRAAAYAAALCTSPSPIVADRPKSVAIPEAHATVIGRAVVVVRVISAVVVARRVVVIARIVVPRDGAIPRVVV